MSHFIDARAQTHALCTLGLLAITLGRSDDSFIAALLNGYGRCDRSWIIHIITGRRRGEKKKIWQTWKKKMQADTYIHKRGRRRKKREENGRPVGERIRGNDALKSRETPKPSIPLSRKYSLDRPSVSCSCAITVACWPTGTGKRGYEGYTEETVSMTPRLPRMREKSEEIGGKVRHSGIVYWKKSKLGKLLLHRNDTHVLWPTSLLQTCYSG